MPDEQHDKVTDTTPNVTSETERRQKKVVNLPPNPWGVVILYSFLSGLLIGLGGALKSNPNGVISTLAWLPLIIGGLGAILSFVGAAKFPRQVVSAFFIIAGSSIAYGLAQAIFGAK